MQNKHSLFCRRHSTSEVCNRGKNKKKCTAEREEYIWIAVKIQWKGIQYIQPNTNNFSQKHSHSHIEHIDDTAVKVHRTPQSE